jgi:4-amino-4-deoxy-L-arabinose transferase-like glycosyltransferase
MSEAAKSSPDRGARREWLAVALLAILFCFANLDSGSLRTWDEAIYAQVAKEFAHSGDWLTPTWNGKPWFHKPPLALWAMALGFRVWGIGEGAVRWGSAICGVIGVLSTFGFTRRVFGREAALLAALVLLGTPQYLVFSKLGMLDVPLTAFVALSVFAYWRSLSDPRWLLAACAAFATGFMIKGTAAVVAPLICLAHVLVHREWSLFRSLHLWAGGAVALAIVAPWHVLQVVEHGRGFLDEYFGFHVLARTTEALEGHAGGPFYYLGALVREQYPWFVLSYVALPYCAFLAWKRKNRAVSLLVCWIGVVFGVYTLIATKINWYIMPAYPALAICIAVFLVRVLGRRHYFKVAAAALVVLVLQGVVTPGVFDLDHGPDVKAVARLAGRLVPPGETLYLYETAIPSVLFYADRRVVEYDEPSMDDLVQRLRERGELVCITRKVRRLESLRRAVGRAGVAVIDTRGDYLLLRLRAPKEASRPGGLAREGQPADISARDRS